MSDYFLKMNRLPESEILSMMRNFAEEKKVPIINDEGLVFLLFLVKTRKIKRILEIGTAIGFSAINMASLDEKIIVETIERDQEMYSIAKTNIISAKMADRIKVIFGDALEIDNEQLSGNYDLIFIDAAKAQYIKFFEKYETMLNNEGIIFTDNLLFHGLVGTDEEIKSKNLRSLVSKISDFNDWLKNNEKYESVFFNIGDGIAVSTRRKNG